LSTVERALERGGVAHDLALSHPRTPTVRARLRIARASPNFLGLRSGLPGAKRPER
jgi:hypothetical protein